MGSSLSSLTPIPEGQIRIECRQYNFRGGAPPYRGYHYSSSFTVEMGCEKTTSDLMRTVKVIFFFFFFFLLSCFFSHLFAYQERVDPSNRRDLSYYLMKEDVCVPSLFLPQTHQPPITKILLPPFSFSSNSFFLPLSPCPSLSYPPLLCRTKKSPSPTMNNSTKLPSIKR